MPALNTDKIIAPGNPGTATSLAAPGYTTGATSITVGSTSNWGTSTGQIFAMDEVETVNGVQVRVDGTYNEYVGTVASGTSITNVSHISGSGTDRNYSAGASTRVYVPVSSNHLNKLHEALTEEHNQDGTHAAVTATSVSTNTISEVTAANGVTIDSLNIKDGKLNTNNSVVTANITDANVTPPKWTNPYKFRVYRNSSWTATAGTDTKVPFNAESYDSNNNFDSTTNYRYTAPVSGFYHFDAAVGVQCGAGDIYAVYIKRNGNTVVLKGMGIVVYFAYSTDFPVSGDIELAAGDYVEVYFTNGSTSNRTGNGTSFDTYFSGHLISQT